MYTKILVPLDGSRLAEQILPYATLFADAFGIPIELLRIDDSGALDLPRGNAYLKDIGDWAFPASVKFTHSVEIADPTEAILRHAAAARSILITMATHGISGIHGLLMGSVAHKVVHRAYNPVLLIRPVEEVDPALAVKFGSLLVPLDGSGLADRILPHVIAVAKAFHIEPTLLRVYALPPESYVIGGGLYMDASARERAAFKKEIDDYLAGKAEELSGSGLSRVSPVAVEGEAAEQIIDFAATDRNVLITMSTHGRSGIGRWLMGSVAEKIVQHCSNPVLLIRAG